MTSAMSASMKKLKQIWHFAHLTLMQRKTRKNMEINETMN